MHLVSIGDYAMHMKQLDPYIGDLPLERIHMGSLQAFIEVRKRAGIKNRSVNLALATVRRVLNLAARLWRDEAGLTWLETPPLIQMLPYLMPVNPTRYHGKSNGSYSAIYQSIWP